MDLRNKSEAKAFNAGYNRGYAEGVKISMQTKDRLVQSKRKNKSKEQQIEFAQNKIIAQYKTIQQLQTTILGLKEELARLQDSNSRLQEDIVYLKHTEQVYDAYSRSISDIISAHNKLVEQGIVGDWK